jgi:hypothetical protein
MAERFELPIPLAAEPMFDGLPEPDPGRLERTLEGWTPMDMAAPVLGLRALMDLVGRIRYKPGYRLRVDDPGMTGGAFLVVTARLRDTYHPEGPVAEQVMRFEAPAWLLERWGEWAEARPERAAPSILAWVRKCLGHHELHERDEWFMVDGLRAFDPHKGDPSGTRLRLHHR